ncbi:MAG TPA: hypothetical protein VMG40_03300 [Bryobacteraceae bacterium]|nr:hypothetical protein [Bryobacteraceae bacterium]
MNPIATRQNKKPLTFSTTPISAANLLRIARPRIEQMTERTQSLRPKDAHRAHVKLRNEPKLLHSPQTFNPVESNHFIPQQQPLSPPLLPEQFALLSRILK